MMNSYLFGRLKVVSYFTAAFLMAFLASGQSVAASLHIKSVRLEKKELVVVVEVPAGLPRVTLEGRARFSAGSWAPRAVLRPSAAGEVTFRLPISEQVEIIRVRGDGQEALPQSFYQGTNSFGGPASSAEFSAGPGTPPVANVTPSPGDKSDTGGGAGAPRDVVESDIWKIDGSTLYFFNQYRGLQVIDLTNPDAPKVRATFSLPAAGEDMYLLGPDRVVLLARDGCDWSADGPESQILVLDTSGPEPKIISKTGVQGQVQESRLVGSALYVATSTYRRNQVTDKNGAISEQWEWGNSISSFDFADPAAPAARQSFWVSGYGNVIYATDRFLAVANIDASSGIWWQSVVNLFDISAPDGTMKKLSSIIPAGQVADKFKLNISGDVLTIISQARSDTRGWVTSLQTFSLAQPETPQKLGRLELAAGDQLHATRFDGDRVYVVTFLRIDPLWVVDLKDPANPKIAGELSVPGWSTYIRPLGDRLVTVGIDNGTNSWRVAVSLFDVHDPAKPALLSKVPLGENYSWSEANNDEKAFNVLPEAGLILVPYQGYTTNGYASRVQLIDLANDSLAARGTIDHNMQPRRATVYKDRILSISGSQLLSVDAANRDLPVMKADLELAWMVNRLFVSGNYLVELATGVNWWDNQNASLRVVSTAHPDTTVARIDLPSNLAVAGAAVVDGKLYLAHTAATYGYVLAKDATASGDASTNPPPNFTLTVVDLSGLPAIKILGQTSATVSGLGWSPSLKAVWPKPGLLTWVGGNSYGPWFFGGPVETAGPGGVVDVAPAPGGAAPDLVATPAFRPWYGYNGGGLWSFDVSSASAPKLVSEVSLATNGWWSFSAPFTASGLVYLSHQSWDFVEGVLLPGQQPPPPTVTYDKETGKYETNQPPVGVYVQRYYLDVVDYADANNPTVRKPVNIPGMLQGIGRGGELLYTVGPHWDEKFATDWTEWLDGSAYDGVSASLVASLHLPTDWPHPILVRGDDLFIGRPQTTNNPPEIETWRLLDTGKFGVVGSAKLPGSAQGLTVFGDLLVAQEGGSLDLLDASVPAALKLLRSEKINGCIWSDLNSADGGLRAGLWTPLGMYGVTHIPPDAP